MAPSFGKFHCFKDFKPNEPFFLQNPTPSDPCLRSPVGTFRSLSYSSAPPLSSPGYARCDFTSILVLLNDSLIFSE